MEKSKVLRGAYAVFVVLVAFALILSLITSAGAARGEDADPPTPLYVLKIDGGRIGVFDAKSDAAEYYLDTPADTLPDYDRDLLYDGIPVYSEEELNERIQDFDG